MRYCIWNNKGGVGKSFLTYCLAVEFAVQHPDKTVAVVDMCPQANVSEMLLGGNGPGEDNLVKCYDNGRTIASYIKSRYDRSRFGKLGDEISYFVKVKDYNSAMPDNLYLLPGDVDLDVCAMIIDFLSRAPERNAWAKSHTFLNDILTVFERNRRDQPVFFIDSNPSFANYTQLGIIAANRLIVPCTADSASIRGIFNVLRLIFDVKLGANLPEESVFDTFVARISDAGISPPKIHSFVLNKSRTMDMDASVAYKSHALEIERLVSDVIQKHPGCFVETAQTYNVKDCNTIAPVLSYIGEPPSSLKSCQYTVYGKKTQVNKSQISPFLENLRCIISAINDESGDELSV